MGNDWYVIITNPNCELKATNELRRAGLRVYLPKRTVEHNHKRLGKVVKTRPAWTGYLLVRFPEALQERGRPKFAIARACQGVKDFVLWMRDTGSSATSNLTSDSVNVNEPAPFPEHVVAAYMRRQRNRDYDGTLIAQKEREGRRANFRIGMNVRVTKGPFASFLARIERTHADTAWIAVEIFGRETDVKMENYTDGLEPLAKSPVAA